MSSKLRRWLLLAAAAGGVLALDQGAKALVMANLALGESWVPIPALAHVIYVTRSLNTGAAFGIFPMASNLFQVMALVTVGVFIWMYPRLPDRAWLSRLSIGLISGGALSNALDRVRFDHVIDFVHVQITPTFANISNFADHAITVGVVLLIIDQWMEERRQAAEAEAAAAAKSEGEAVGEELDGSPISEDMTVEESTEVPVESASLESDANLEQPSGYD
jgi:signal peptidase II